MTKRFLYYFILVLALFLIFSQKAEATCTGSPPTCNCGGSRTDTEYRCSSTDCPGAVIQKHTKTCTWSCSWEKTCTCTDSTWDCGNCLPGTETCGSWGSPEDIKTCESWQKCGSTTWSSTQNTCQCNKDCLATPQNPRYYNNPTYSDQSDKNKGSTDIYLPVKLDWDDVAGFGQTDGPQSYVISIEDAAQDPFSQILTESEYDPQEDNGSCFLKSDFTHNWHVKACCTDKGGDCGSESNWSFSTSLAPEPVSPLDPDWEGSQGASNVSIPVNFDWCDVENAQSYIIQIYKDGVLRHVDGVTKINDTLPSEIEIDGLEVFTGLTTYKWEVTACFNENGSKCGASCGESDLAKDCADFSQRWSFATLATGITPPQLLKPFYNPTKPEEIPTVNLDSILEWTRTEYEGRWARSYFFEIKEGTTIVVFPTLTTSYIVPFETVWSSLSFNTTYNWHVKSCYGEGGTDCSDFGDSWYFKTTGTQPTNLSQGPTTEDGKVIIPAKLDWNDIAGAVSYKYEVSSDSSFSSDKIVASGVVEASETFVDYPNLVQDTDYWWRVRTCADKAGAICGDWSNSQNFKTFKLGVPSNPSPQNGGRLFTYEKYISWDPVLGAKLYQYKIDYGGAEKIPLTIVSTNSVFLPTEQLELGNYSWYVQACLDKDCNAHSGSSTWSFVLVQPTPPTKFGLVPCGRVSDNPNTPWNEREPCEIKHLFILLRNILDLFLWRIGLIILVLLVVTTGVIYYFSMGAPTTMAKVKSILKSAGTGYAVIFLAWTIINMLLKILGITTKWWILPF